MHCVKAAYAITEACDRVMDSKLKSALCKEIVTLLIDSLAFLGLVSSELNQFRRDYLKNVQKFYAFPPFSLIGATLPKIRRDRLTGIMIIRWWGTQFWFPNAATPIRLSNSATTNKEYIDFTIKESRSLSTTSKTKTTGGSFIREAISNRELPQEIEEVITDSWRTSTRTRYESVLKQWKCYALSRNENPYITNIDSVLKFLHGMYNDDCLYSGLCAARGTLASVVTIKGFAKLSDHPLLVRYLKGKFNRHPLLPRYMHIWDINLVLT